MTASAGLVYHAWTLQESRKWFRPIVVSSHFIGSFCLSPAARCRRLLQAPVMPGRRRCFAASFGVDRGWKKFRPSKMYRSVSELGYERKDEPPYDLPARKQYLSLFIYTLYTICAYIANSSFLKDDRKHPYVHKC